MQRSTENAASLAGEWAKLWFDMLSPMTPWMAPLNCEGTLPEIGRQLQSAQLKWWNEYLARFMRSPDFLEMVRNSMTAVLNSRKQMNDWLGEVQHEAQRVTPEDIDHLDQMLRRQEEQFKAAMRKVLRRLDELSDRLSAWEDRDEKERDPNVNGRPSNRLRPRTRRRADRHKTSRSDEI
jgi:hypothetical protein